MRLKSIELSGFKSFAKKTSLEFSGAITAIVGPNGSGKSNVAESFRFVLGEQSMKSMRGRRGEDMVWNGSAQIPRAGRASVRLVLDNSDRSLALDFDEVSIERVVHRDGGNEYMLNGSQVRLRDIAELLAGANIGASGHHIISQGEADRVLAAGSRERREMIEDALGLTAFLYKREEAERKLEKTAENMREVEALRRELAPHLKFLATQVRKIDEAQSMRGELAERLLEYCKRESVYVTLTRATLLGELEAPTVEHQQLDERIALLREELGKKRSDAGSEELMRLEAEGRQAHTRRDEISRELGRIEGQLQALASAPKEEHGTMPVAQAQEFAQRIEKELGELQTLEGQGLRSRLAALAVLVQEFLRRVSVHTSIRPGAQVSQEELLRKKAALEQELEGVRTEGERVTAALAALRARIEGEKDAMSEAQRELFEAMAKRSALEATIAQLRGKEQLLEREEQALRSELAEAGVLVGAAIAEWESYVVLEGGERLSDADIAGEDRARQEDRRRKIERMKIRLEEAGLGNSSEILKEHQETSERDQFLARELEDLAKTSESLRQLIEELTQTLEARFVDGIAKINTEFETFFTLMFGGGSAALSIVKEKKARRGAALLEGGEEEGEDEDVEEGVDIAISLPHKRIKGLHMLSGGERALTSIALIFAMSQVNPPPFLILDETDAALDEANSRRYGDMIENLARKSQLILITHNRETMSRAGMLYGITMGQGGASKLLSVQFEEAVAVAK